MDDSSAAGCEGLVPPGGSPAEGAAGTDSRCLHVIETAQTVLTALALAFIFRAFLVEAFIIPTGSMAESLCGQHATRTCSACGWEFDFNLPAPGETFCPNCHAREPVPQDVAAKAGDRILVHKWPYLLGGWLGPRRWDVIVFRNPADPGENYIKRLIGRPGETVEIVDGDVYINGRMARKPPAVQRQLWLVVFDQNFFPARREGAASPLRWQPEPGTRAGEAGWSGLDRRIIRYAGRDQRERSICFTPADPSYFQDVYGYNGGPSRQETPYYNDARLVGELRFLDGQGGCTFELRRPGLRCRAEVRRDGRLTLALDGERAAWQWVQERELGQLPHGRPMRLELAHVDQRVYVAIDGRELLARDLANEVAGPVPRSPGPAGAMEFRVGAADTVLELRGLRIDRDVYYTTSERFTRRAYAGNPFVLEADEYFVLGDNSPDSRDSREWTETGPLLPADYRPGTVRASQIVGSAAFVYLPGLLPLDGHGRWRLPDAGRMRFVR